MNNIYNYDFQELETKITELNVPKYRTKQIWNWLYVHFVSQFDEMKNISQADQNILKEYFYIPQIKITEEKKSNDKTKKVLLQYGEEDLVESVLMTYKHGQSVCVTTQIGCKIGCAFCASCLAGFKRNLSTGEIIEQIIYWSRLLRERGERVSHIVLMGTGEPMENIDNVLRFFQIVNDDKGLKIGARHITVSTSGIVPGIEKFSEYPKQINLAVSLHAPNNELRTELIPVNRRYPLEKLMPTLVKYQEKTNRQITFEYIMIKDVNINDKIASELIDVVRNFDCVVNLIKYNPVDEYDFVAPSEDEIEKFIKILEKAKVIVTYRKQLGNEIDGACGQLRLKKIKDRNA